MTNTATPTISTEVELTGLGFPCAYRGIVSVDGVIVARTEWISTPHGGRITALRQADALAACL